MPKSTKTTAAHSARVMKKACSDALAHGCSSGGKTMSSFAHYKTHKK